jgi:RND family efflux transporter MFP subunit
MKLRLRVGLVMLLSCRANSHDDHTASHHDDREEEDSRRTLSFTHWTEQTELFVEIPAFVQGLESSCAAHVTRLSDFKPVESGSVTISLRDGSEDRAVADKPSSPGIFRPVLRPSAAGRRRLMAVVDRDGARDEHDLGEVVVDETKETVARAAASAPGRRITFLKEQQWATTFATQAASARSLRATVRATGSLQPRIEGDVTIAAPFAGRITSQGPFPRVGTRVAPDQTLAALTPRLEGTDQASLDLAIASAKLELQHAERERRRVEALRAEGAVPDRRVTDAVYAEDDARAALAAAEKRRGQFARVQQPRAAHGEGTVQLRSPIAGTIVSVQAAPGGFVEAGTRLFHVVDPTLLWLDARVAAVDSTRATDIRGAWFDIDGIETLTELGTETIAGRSPRLDPVAQTLSVLFNVENAGARLPVGAFARVQLIIGEPTQALAIPKSAVVDDNGQTIAFVQVEGEAFERRIVRLGTADGPYVAVLSGVSPGERVVSRGAWSVKLAASAASVLQHGHPH